jgi:hypothetical protein
MWNATVKNFLWYKITYAVHNHLFATFAQIKNK